MLSRAKGARPPVIAVIGLGRLGHVLAGALRAARFTVHGPLSRAQTRSHIQISRS